MIDKIQSDPNNYKINMFFYRRARDAMYEAVLQLHKKGYHEIFIPGYIGWSPREGSGIFDPLQNIDGLKRNYYRMTGELEIDIEVLQQKLNKNSMLLVVNYFGFRDKNIDTVIQIAREKECIIIEDNAHGFFTFYCHGSVGADITFFSLHKMFPMKDGGSLLVLNDKLNILPRNCLKDYESINPFEYDINGIARCRKENFKILMSLMKGNEAYFTAFKSLNDIVDNVPQTFPILIRKGNRNIIYEKMNSQGYGVVSLYHTMVEELKIEEHKDACQLSKQIMNLPIHQDCDSTGYQQMIEVLKQACCQTDK